MNYTRSFRSNSSCLPLSISTTLPTCYSFQPNGELRLSTKSICTAKIVPKGSNLQRLGQFSVQSESRRRPTTVRFLSLKHLSCPHGIYSCMLVRLTPETTIPTAITRSDIFMSATNFKADIYVVFSINCNEYVARVREVRAVRRAGLFLTMGLVYHSPIVIFREMLRTMNSILPVSGKQWADLRRGSLR
ncbi:hypothetical protein EJ08DRAFT_269470 [Tothia fuscella]|uniref:Uncharacterized protein n=1 Tax=Tothia fuscella TaxID=1048955 RepID=A0A9P4NPB6_9PEZI|nr:hypothetical protein EJ08DRAFT_269470 [Tothia fuscella]